VGRIRQLESLSYFAEGSEREPGEEIVSEPHDDEVVVFEEFFTAGLRIARSHRNFAQVSGAAASANPERYCSAI
jgi:hypothetical protein